ncbi:SMI1/KNR4 family protein [Kibdelosporangium philippinense]|uniref:SMI1/KNR4 family protein n=1 Tax=Kibdelosporangium philippinense TaxID=211113 RepID=A0ABS8ZST0_9PSEU|nr:SMI1/KNR4 family protein [Kibdelosporangium philippinense]MCE7010769.1 SMI1/KNR4 family protein [Kibdelosporangium philippinense]
MHLARIEEQLRAIAVAVMDSLPYPPGENTVGEPGGIEELVAEFGGDLPADVVEFFSAIGAVSLPDLWNGYFIGPTSWSSTLRRTGELREVLGHGDVLVVASNGGGTLYAIPRTGEVLVLPLAGIENGVYLGQAREVADSLEDFIDGLINAATSGEWDPFDPDRS